KVRIDPDGMGRANEALTRNDVRALIMDGVVYRAEIEGRRSNKDKRRGRGHGSRKGSSNARTPRKQTWMMHVRSQRKYLAEMVESGEIPKEHKRSIYMKIKSGIFKSRKAMHIYLNENGMLKESKK
ncbi:MAG: 50S ribosomal protein L19e, partial [Candidatus Micrarchaeia archaeon]